MKIPDFYIDQVSFGPFALDSDRPKPITLATPKEASKIQSGAYLEVRKDPAIADRLKALLADQRTDKSTVSESWVVLTVITECSETTRLARTFAMACMCDLSKMPVAIRATFQGHSILLTGEFCVMGMQQLGPADTPPSAVISLETTQLLAQITQTT